MSINKLLRSDEVKEAQHSYLSRVAQGLVMIGERCEVCFWVMIDDQRVSAQLRSASTWTDRKERSNRYNEFWIDKRYNLGYGSNVQRSTFERSTVR